MLIVLDGFDQQHLTFKFLWRFCDKLGRTCTAVEQLGFHTIFHQNNPHSLLCLLGATKFPLKGNLIDRLTPQWTPFPLSLPSLPWFPFPTFLELSLTHLQHHCWVKSANTWFTKERLWVAAVGKKLRFLELTLFYRFTQQRKHAGSWQSLIGGANSWHCCHILVLTWGAPTTWYLSLSSFLSRLVFHPSHCGVFQLWKGKQNIGEAHTHMGGLSEKSVVAEQLLALVRPPQPTHAPALLLLLLLLNSATQKLHHLPLESSLPSSRREWEMQLKFDELVWEGFCRNGYEEALVGQVGGGLACLDGDGAQTGFTDRCPKHLLTTPGSTLITRGVL